MELTVEQYRDGMSTIHGLLEHSISTMEFLENPELYNEGYIGKATKLLGKGIGRTGAIKMGGKMLNSAAGKAVDTFVSDKEQAEEIKNKISELVKHIQTNYKEFIDRALDLVDEYGDEIVVGKKLGQNLLSPSEQADYMEKVRALQDDFLGRIYYDFMYALGRASDCSPEDLKGISELWDVRKSFTVNARNLFLRCIKEFAGDDWADNPILREMSQHGINVIDLMNETLDYMVNSVRDGTIRMPSYNRNMLKLAKDTLTETNAMLKLMTLDILKYDLDGNKRNFMSDERIDAIMRAWDEIAEVLIDLAVGGDSAFQNVRNLKVAIKYIDKTIVLARKLTDQMEDGIEKDVCLIGIEILDVTKAYLLELLNKAEQIVVSDEMCQAVMKPVVHVADTLKQTVKVLLTRDKSKISEFADKVLKKVPGQLKDDVKNIGKQFVDKAKSELKTFNAEQHLTKNKAKQANVTNKRETPKATEVPNNKSTTTQKNADAMQQAFADKIKNTKAISMKDLVDDAKQTTQKNVEAKPAAPKDIKKQFDVEGWKPVDVGKQSSMFDRLEQRKQKQTASSAPVPTAQRKSASAPSVKLPSANRKAKKDKSLLDRLSNNSTFMRNGSLSSLTNLSRVATECTTFDEFMDWYINESYLLSVMMCEALMEI